MTPGEQAIGTWNDDVAKPEVEATAADIKRRSAQGIPAPDRPDDIANALDA